MASSTRWCFTLNNYTQEEYEDIKSWSVKYAIVGREVGEEETPHLQGYAVFAKMQRLSAMKKLQPRAHWEVAKGTTQQNYEYCTKQDQEALELGERPDYKHGGQAEKERWKRAFEAACEGRLEDVPEDIRIKYYRTFKEIKKDYMQKVSDADEVTGVWYWGPPGVGKSRKAREDFPDAYLKMQNKWWDGYQDEDYVILDDFDSKELGHHLKIWGDRYAFLAETKGGAIQIRPKKIVVTSNYSIDDLFGHDQEMCGAIKRRFASTHFNFPLGAPKPRI